MAHGAGAGCPARLTRSSECGTRSPRRCGHGQPTSPFEDWPTRLDTLADADTLLSDPDLQIFPGKGMTCALDPERAACRLREEDGTRRTPDLDDYRPNRVDIARADRDLEHVLGQIEQLRPLVDDRLAPAFRHAREQHVLDRLERIDTAHDHIGEPRDGH